MDIIYFHALTIDGIKIYGFPYMLESISYLNSERIQIQRGRRKNGVLSLKDLSILIDVGCSPARQRVAIPVKATSQKENKSGTLSHSELFCLCFPKTNCRKTRSMPKHERHQFHQLPELRKYLEKSNVCLIDLRESQRLSFTKTVRVNQSRKDTATHGKPDANTEGRQSQGSPLESAALLTAQTQG